MSCRVNDRPADPVKAEAKRMTGWDGGFFGLPFTCECKIYGETEGRKNCSKFEKKITKSDLLNKIQSLEKENEQLQQEKEKLIAKIDFLERVIDGDINE